MAELHALVYEVRTEEAGLQESKEAGKFKTEEWLGILESVLESDRLWNGIMRLTDYIVSAQILQ